MLWTRYLVNYLSLFHLAFFRVFSCSFIWKKFLYLLILFNFLCLSEAVTYPIPEGVFWSERVLMQSACAQWLWWESWQLPPWRELGLEMERLEPESGVSQDFYAQWPSLPVWEWSHVPRYWSRSPDGWIWAGSSPSKCALFPQQLYLHPSGEQHWSKKG